MLPRSNGGTTFAEVVTASVNTALQDEKSKNEVIVAQMTENKDNDDIKALCDKAGIVTRPTAIKYGWENLQLSALDQ